MRLWLSCKRLSKFRQAFNAPPPTTAADSRRVLPNAAELPLKSSFHLPLRYLLNKASHHDAVELYGAQQKLNTHLLDALFIS